MKSDLPTKAESALDRLVDQAKQDLEPRVTAAAWSAMEERLLARMAQTTEARAGLVEEVNVTSLASRRRARFFQAGAAALAVAAAIAVFVRKDQGPAPGESTASIVADPSVSALRATEGTGDVRISGVVASTGHELRAGDVIEVDGARAVLERPHRVQWLLERSVPEAAGSGGKVRLRSAMATP